MRGCVGTWDRVVRVVVGMVLLAVGITQVAGIAANLRYVADAVGAIVLLTGLGGYCPLYALFGVRTCMRPA